MYSQVELELSLPQRHRIAQHLFFAQSMIAPFGYLYSYIPMKTSTGSAGLLS